MCGTCGCNIPQTIADGHESVEVLTGLLDANDHQAAHNREHFSEHGVLAINLMSSPGAGKTALLEATIEAFDVTMFALRSLKATLRPKTMLSEFGRRVYLRFRSAQAVPATLMLIWCMVLCTIWTCRVSMSCLSKTSATWFARPVSILASISMWLCYPRPRVDDKPAKYPVMFRAADLVLDNEIRFVSGIGRLRSRRGITLSATAGQLRVPMLDLSAKTGDGMQGWVNWVEEARA